MDLDQFPLSMFEVDCDGSACGSGDVGRHIHPPQGLVWTGPAICRVRVVEHRRVGYTESAGIERLVTL